MQIALSPVVPKLSQRIFQQLGFDDQRAANISWSDIQWGVMAEGDITAPPQPIFGRIDCDFVAEPAPAPVPAAAGGKKK